LEFLKTSVLPPDMPPIDIKVKHKDPLGNNIYIKYLFYVLQLHSF